MNLLPVGAIDDEWETPIEEEDNVDGAIYDNDDHKLGFGSADIWCWRCYWTIKYKSKGST